MKRFVLLVTLAFTPFCFANAEVWKWVDDDGNVHYGDRPQHESAAGVQLASHRPGSPSAGDASTSAAAPDSADAEAEKAQAYYCEQATEAYNRYASAPKLFETDSDGERRYLSDEEMAKAIADSKASMNEWCSA